MRPPFREEDQRPHRENREAIAMKREATGNRRTTDGKRKRRHSPLKAKREWYAKYRALRFARHLGF